MLHRFVTLAIAAFALFWAAGAAGMGSQVPDAVVFTNGGNVIRMYVDGSERVQLTATAMREHGPAVSPDALRIAFGRGGDELWTMDTQGSDQRRVVAARHAAVRDARTGSPAWSADGRSLYFDRVNQTPKEICGSIFRVNVGSGGPRRLTAGVVTGSLETDPAVSPDGSRIVLSSGECEPGFGAELAIVSSSGRPTADLRKLRRTPGIQLAPTWAPDGTRIAFVVSAEASEKSAVYVVNRDGSRLRRVTQWTVATGAPAWSPDGEWIAFHKEGGLFLIRPNGTALQRLQGTKAGDASPAWLTRT